MEYSHKFGSNYPIEPIPIGTKKDIDNKTKQLISDYYRCIDEGSIDVAHNLYQRNKKDLDPYIVNAEYFNRLEEEIYNVGVKAIDTSNMQTIVVLDTEPSSQSQYSHWLKEY